MRPIVMACAAVLALAACDDSTTGPQPISSGSVTFAIPAIGDQPATTFNASGAVRLDSAGLWKIGNWAFADFTSTRNSPIDLTAFAPAGEGRWHYVLMGLPRDTRTGDVLNLALHCMTRDTECADFGFITEITLKATRPGAPEEFGSYTALCKADSGTIRITGRGGGRIKGVIDAPAGCGRDGQSGWFVVQINGSFDVPLLDNSQYILESTE